MFGSLGGGMQGMQGYGMPPFRSAAPFQTGVPVAPHSTAMSSAPPQPPKIEGGPGAMGTGGPMDIMKLLQQLIQMQGNNGAQMQNAGYNPGTTPKDVTNPFSGYMMG